MSVSTLTGSFGSIYVPASLVTRYKAATNWATYADRITAIENESGDETGPVLESISAEYIAQGGVMAGFALSELTNFIVVTAHYADGTSETVTDYTLSGEIVEGNNTITVTYKDKTTTFIVLGLSAGGGDM